jgi:Tfp pilus assembly protein PilN
LQEQQTEKKTVATLGCGTLILIALIVLFIGRADTEPLENEIRALRDQVLVLSEEQAEMKRLVETLVLSAGEVPADPEDDAAMP